MESARERERETAGHTGRKADVNYTEERSSRHSGSTKRKRWLADGWMHG
jgi:hypothetical protein